MSSAAASSQRNDGSGTSPSTRCGQAAIAFIFGIVLLDDHFTGLTATKLGCSGQVLGYYVGTLHQGLSPNRLHKAPLTVGAMEPLEDHHSARLVIFACTDWRGHAATACELSLLRADRVWPTHKFMDNRLSFAARLPQR